MRFDPGKAWPHPVLRPSCGDDYPHAEFQVEIDMVRSLGNTSVDVSVTFDLSDRDLLQLVDASRAIYVILIRAPRTHYRDLHQSNNREIKVTIPHGILSGRVELTPFLICTDKLTQFQAKGWHQDFGGRSFDIAPGSVLAEDRPNVYWVDTADETPLGSAVEIVQRPGLSDGRWELDLNQERVAIAMSSADYRRFTAARERMYRTTDAQYLMNGLYLPALIQILNEADRDSNIYSEYRWFSSLDQRLDAVGCKPLGSERSDRLVDAQKVLDSPFGRMPFILQDEGDF